MIYAQEADMVGLFDVELPDGRQLLDITGGQLAYLAGLYRCSVEFIMPAPRVFYLPMRQAHEA